MEQAMISIEAAFQQANWDSQDESEYLHYYAIDQAWQEFDEWVKATRS